MSSLRKLGVQRVPARVAAEKTTRSDHDNIVSVSGPPVVAMIGGGQLARMTHQAAIALGQTLRVLAASPDDPAAQVTPDVVIGSHTDPRHCVGRPTELRL